MQNKSKSEPSFWQNIVDKIGPLSLIVLALTLALQLANQPISYATSISIILIVVVMVIGFFLEKRRLELAVKLREHIAWIEGNRPLLEASAKQGLKRNARFEAFEAVARVLRKEISDGDMTDEQKQALSTFLGKIEAMKEATLFT